MPVADDIKAKQSFFETKDERLLQAEVEKAICILFPKSVLIAAVTGKGESIMVQSYAADSQTSEWDIQFFQSILNNQIFIKNEHVKIHFFVATKKQILIPDTIHQGEYAGELLRDIFYILPDEHVLSYHCKADKAQLVIAFHKEIEDIARPYFSSTEIKPLNISHFGKPEKMRGYKLDCIIGEEQVWASLRKDGRLLWHQSFPYDIDLDIVFQFAHLCREWGVGMEEVYLYCMATTPEAMSHIYTLESFFPDTSFGFANAETEWIPVINLIQQLNSCV